MYKDIIGYVKKFYLFWPWPCILCHNILYKIITKGIQNERYNKMPYGQTSCKPDGWPAGNPKFMNTKKAWDLVGGLSKPGKMPGWSIGIPAAECNTGSKLRLIPNQFAVPATP